MITKLVPLDQDRIRASISAGAPHCETAIAANMQQLVVSCYMLKLDIVGQWQTWPTI